MPSLLSSQCLCDNSCIWAQSHWGDNLEGTLFLWFHSYYDHFTSVRFEPLCVSWITYDHLYISAHFIIFMITYVLYPYVHMLVFLFFTLHLLFQTLWNFSWSHYSWDFVACEPIKYNEFQISGNKSYETPYIIPKSIILKKWKLVRIFIRITATSYLALSILIFLEALSMKKIDI